jgi:alkaline phosphatase D
MCKRDYFAIFLLILVLTGNASFCCNAQSLDSVQQRHKVTLNQAHVGSLHIDTLLLDSYGRLPENIRQFYLDARLVLSENADADFTHPRILESAQHNKIALMGGPMLGDLGLDGVTIWLRPGVATSLRINVFSSDVSQEKSYFINISQPGVVQRIRLDELASDTEYNYIVFDGKQKIAEGCFRTVPASHETSLFKLAFGSCFHKIGVHNPNIINQILKRKPHAMALLGDIAVDDRENQINLHRADYLLRDASIPWQRLAANVPLYATWDDHDYLNNDLSGIPEGFSEEDRDRLRAVWSQNWNNPDNIKEGIYFNTRIGPVELIMLDTRSCREIENRENYGSYLGMEQQEWLIATLKESTAPFKVISSGTMWSDYISNGKDSWGTWDTLARNEVFQLIEKEKISGVLLISGDRHGARAFKIPVSSEFSLCEFEAASLGGVPGPNAMAKDSKNQLFGYEGEGLVAFGEFTFDMRVKEPIVSFRLIDQLGIVLEEHILPYRRLSPKDY